MINQGIGNYLQVAGNDLVKLVQSQIDAMIADSVFGEIISPNSLASITGTDQTFALVGSLLVFLLLKVVIKF